MTIQAGIVPTGQIAGTPPALIMKIYARRKKGERFGA